MVPALKEAATTLKQSGVNVMAVDGQVSAGVARQLGVQMYPTIMWLQVGDEGVLIVRRHDIPTRGAMCSHVEPRSDGGWRRHGRRRGGGAGGKGLAAAERVCLCMCVCGRRSMLGRGMRRAWWSSRRVRRR